MMFFLCILAVCIIAYGVSSRAMVHPNSLSFNARDIFSKLVYRPYFFLYGYFEEELKYLDELVSSKNDSNNGVRDDITSAATATYILLALHMLFINILLINLLIATFK